MISKEFAFFAASLAFAFIPLTFMGLEASIILSLVWAVSGFRLSMVWFFTRLTLRPQILQVWFSGGVSLASTVNAMVHDQTLIARMGPPPKIYFLLTNDWVGFIVVTIATSILIVSSAWWLKGQVRRILYTYIPTRLTKQ